MTENDRAILFIRELTKKTVEKGCTESEALAAAKKIDELMRFYNLTLDKIFLDKTACVLKKVDTGRHNRHPVDGCITGIADFCDCKVWINLNKRDNSYYCFFGLETDTEMAEYLYHNIFNAMNNEIEKFKLSEIYTKSNKKKRLSVSFLKGMASRIYSRLKEISEKRKAEETKEIQYVDKNNVMQSTSLIVLKENKVEEELAKIGIKFRKKYSYSNSRLDCDAYASGKKAGDKVNLNRPLGDNGEKVLYLN